MVSDVAQWRRCSSDGSRTENMSVPPADSLISVALCTYNGAQHLRQQLDSLLAQTYRPLEIVAVDDGSTDATRAILEEYRARDTRLRVFENPSNLGFRRNFERAMSLCTGEFIAPCDQDDVWLPEKLSTLRDAIAERALAYCDSELTDEQGRPLALAVSNRYEMVSTGDPAVFTMHNCIPGHAMLFRRTLLARALPLPDCFFHDWWLAAVAASCGGVIYCNRKLVRYRQHAHSVTDIAGRRPLSRKARTAANWWDKQREQSRRMEQLATLPGSHQQLVLRLRDLWLAREQEWISPALAAFMFRHGPRLYGVRKTSAHARLGYFLRFLPGLRLKRLAVSRR